MIKWAFKRGWNHLFDYLSSINPRLHNKNKEHWVANFFFIFPFGRYVFVR